METFSVLFAICVGNSPVPDEFPAQRPVTHSFDVFFDLRLNKRLNKQSWGWWFETLSHPLLRHCNEPTYCCLMTPYGFTKLGQYFVKLMACLVAWHYLNQRWLIPREVWRHSSGAISHEMLKISIIDMILTNAHLGLQPHSQGPMS